MTLGAVVLDDGATILPVERVYLDDGAIKVDVVIPRGVRYDGRDRKPYALMDPDGRVVTLASLGPIGLHSSDDRGDWHLHLRLEIVRRMTARYQEEHR